jgi:hypothetical protein
MNLSPRSKARIFKLARNQLFKLCDEIHCLSPLGLPLELNSIDGEISPQCSQIFGNEYDYLCHEQSLAGHDQHLLGKIYFGFGIFKLFADDTASAQQLLPGALNS